MYAFQSESIFYSCLNDKELLALSRREIWSLSDCNWTRIQNHLVRPNGWMFVYELSGSGFESSCSHYKSCIYFSWLCPVSLTLFCTVASLKVPVMIVFDAAKKVLDTKKFPQHTIADLNSAITFVLFIQEKPLQWKEINIHKHTHTISCYK